VVARGEQAGGAEELVAFGRGEPQRAGDGRDHLRGGIGGPALLQAQHVLDGEAGEFGEFLAAQAGGAAARRPGVAGLGRVEAVTPAA
jgi:hypothetical protein